MACLVDAIEWAARSGMHIVNLSLGTPRREHESALLQAMEVAAASGALIVAAREDDGVRYLPGSLPGAIAVDVDWTCPRGEYRIVDVDGVPVVRTSGLPRQIPGVPPEKNLHGLSFAVANATAFVARAMEDPAVRTHDQVLRRLGDEAGRAG